MEVKGGFIFKHRLNGVVDFLRKGRNGEQESEQGKCQAIHVRVTFSK
jgi:hypothetical protein